MGERTRVGEGAGASAPTAPHATPPHTADETRTGPARFWSPRRVRQGLAFGFVLSGAFHYFISPFSLLPEGPPLDFHEQSGELSIPVDLIGEGTGDKPGSKSGDPQGANGAAGASDAAIEAQAAGQGADGGVADDAGGDASMESTDDGGGLVAVTDGGVGRDPKSILGAAAVSAGPENITILVNFAELRKHPEASRLGLVLGGIPQWRAFMANAQGTMLLDPMRDADWMFITGPSLIETQNDAIFVHYSTPDAQVDRVIDTVSHHYAKGGPIDLGVPGVKAWKAFADNGERVFMRPHPHIAVIVPSSHAVTFARAFAHTPITPHMRAGEALSVRALRPGGSLPAVPQDISEMRLWIVPRASDAGGDLYIEADCPSDAAAQTDAEALKTLIQQKNSFGVRLVTAGFFNHVDITTVGNQVHAHINGTQEQIEALLALVAGRIGVTLPPPSHYAPPPTQPAPSNTE